MMRLTTAAKYKMMSEYCTMEEVAATLDPKASMIILAKNATIGKYDNGTNIFRSESSIGYVYMYWVCVYVLGVCVCMCLRDML